MIRDLWLVEVKKLVVLTKAIQKLQKDSRLGFFGKF
jgi:hypothetical protein